MRKRESWVRKYTPIMGASKALAFYRLHQSEAGKASAIARMRRKFHI